MNPLDGLTPQEQAHVVFAWGLAMQSRAQSLEIELGRWQKIAGDVKVENLLYKNALRERANAKH